jgi:hypothetical protein
MVPGQLTEGHAGSADSVTGTYLVALTRAAYFSFGVTTRPGADGSRKPSWGRFCQDATIQALQLHERLAHTGRPVSPPQVKAGSVRQ